MVETGLMEALGGCLERGKEAKSEQPLCTRHCRHIASFDSTISCGGYYCLSPLYN